MDRITRLRIKNVRAIEDLDLDLSQLTVLIGENGSGKSTIIECLELLRKAADSSFFQQFYSIHRGMPGLLRKGATEIVLSVVVENEVDADFRIEYSLSIGINGPGAEVRSERFTFGPDGPGQVDLERTQSRVVSWNFKGEERLHAIAIKPDQLLASLLFDVELLPDLKRLRQALLGIEVHLGFDTLSAWAAQAIQRPLTLRGTSLLQPAERLSLLGQNLASAWFALKNVDDAHWQSTMGLLRLGLGERVETINVLPDAGGGHIGLTVKFVDLLEPIHVSSLSDGQLSWLVFVAIARLGKGRSILVIDEPELHLHPALLGRVVALLSEIDGEAPVLISTHSDRVLEMLADPADAVRVCSLVGSRAKVSRIDRDELTKWLERFGDLGQLRSSGYLSRVLVPEPANVQERPPG